MKSGFELKATRYISNVMLSMRVVSTYLLNTYLAEVEIDHKNKIQDAYKCNK